MHIKQSALKRDSRNGNPQCMGIGCDLADLKVVWELAQCDNEDAGNEELAPLARKAATKRTVSWRISRVLRPEAPTDRLPAHLRCAALRDSDGMHASSRSSSCLSRAAFRRLFKIVIEATPTLPSLLVDLSFAWCKPSAPGTVLPGINIPRKASCPWLTVKCAFWT